MSEVWIYHEGLDRYAQVPESAVGMHNMAGWVQQDPPPEPEPEEESQPATKTAAKKIASKSAEPTEGDEK
jgi:hypothetical protein